MEAYKFPIPGIQIGAVLPMVIVAITGMLGLIAELVRPKKTNDLVVAISVSGLVLAAIALLSQIGNAEYSTLNDMVVSDRFGTCAQLFIVLSAAVAILFSEGYLREKKIPFAEFYPLIVWASVGAMMIAATTHLLVLFLGVEILSVALYVMAGLSRREERSEEAAIKYFLLGAFASGFLLYGIALIYGGSGTLSLDQIPVAWTHRNAMTTPVMTFGVAMLLIGLGFKSSLVPFHQWTPDVYQGAPTNVAGFMATGAKIGAFAGLFRVLDGMRVMTSTLVPMLIVVAVLTMVVGNVAALRQKDFKRVLGYSSIAHAGYVLAAMAVNLPNIQGGSNTILWYMLSYASMTLGAFAVMSFAARRGVESTRLEHLHGLAKRSPFLAFCLTIFISSLAGFPFTAGFWAKWFVLTDAIAAHYTWLAVVIAINSIVSLVYYFGILQAAMTPSSDENAVDGGFPKLHGGLVGACAVCAAFVVGGFFLYQPIITLLGSK